MLLASCGTMQKAATTTSTTATSSSTDGQAAGRALKALYTQYKADGKFDATNLSNIANTMLLIQNCKGLKTSFKDSNYWKAFAQGLILGSDNLVTQQVSNTVTSQLSNMMQNIDTEKLESAGQNASQAASAAASAASSLKSIFNLFSK